MTLQKLGLLLFLLFFFIVSVGWLIVGDYKYENEVLLGYRVGRISKIYVGTGWSLEYNYHLIPTYLVGGMFIWYNERGKNSTTPDNDETIIHAHLRSMDMIQVGFGIATGNVTTYFASFEIIPCSFLLFESRAKLTFGCLGFALDYKHPNYDNKSSPFFHFAWFKVFEIGVLF